MECDQYYLNSMEGCFVFNNKATYKIGIFLGRSPLFGKLRTDIVHHTRIKAKCKKDFFIKIISMCFAGEDGLGIFCLSPVFNDQSVGWTMILDDISLPRAISFSPNSTVKGPL